MDYACVVVLVALVASVLLSNFVIGRMGRAGFPKDSPNDHEGWGAKTVSRLSKRRRVGFPAI